MTVHVTVFLTVPSHHCPVSSAKIVLPAVDALIVLL